MKTATHDCQSRSKYYGVFQVLVFNWRLYTVAAVVLALGGFVLEVMNLPSPWNLLVRFGTGLVAFWILASLSASHWVYDLSPVCKYRWIADSLPEQPGRWVNIHAGLDESSAALRLLFPGTTGEVLDIFDSREMTESSIAEARRRPGNQISATHADFRSLPEESGILDTVFLLFAAHEIRRLAPRLQFFGELNRVLKSSGQIVITEHLRDWRNFLAYGPGCFHFQSRGVWLRAAGQTGFVLQKEFAITPFVRVFIFKKPR